MVIFTDKWDSHICTLDHVLASWTLNLAKCEFGHATVTYLGKQVGQGIVRLLDAFEAIKVLFFLQCTCSSCQ